MQRGIGANGHICTAEVIVDRADDTDDVELFVERFLLNCDFVETVELLDEGRPLLPQFIRASQGTVTSDNAEMSDRPFDKIQARSSATFAFFEAHAARGTDNRPTELDDARNVEPFRAVDLVAAFN
jgi:hypothetical protein